MLQRIGRKLDRALCNEECLDEWSSLTYQVLVKNCFDHSPILIILSSSTCLHKANATSTQKLNNYYV